MFLCGFSSHLWAFSVENCHHDTVYQLGEAGKEASDMVIGPHVADMDLEVGDVNVALLSDACVLAAQGLQVVHAEALNISAADLLERIKDPAFGWGVVSAVAGGILVAAGSRVVGYVTLALGGGLAIYWLAVGPVDEQ